MSGMYFLDPGKSAEDYEQMARDVVVRQQERLDRNGGDLDDCFVSNRCDDLTIHVYEMLAALVRAGGKHPFTVLKTLDGQTVKAKVIVNRFGRSTWAIVNDQPLKRLACNCALPQS